MCCVQDGIQGAEGASGAAGRRERADHHQVVRFIYKSFVSVAGNHAIAAAGLDRRHQFLNWITAAHQL